MDPFISANNNDKAIELSSDEEYDNSSPMRAAASILASAASSSTQVKPEDAADIHLSSAFVKDAPKPRPKSLAKAIKPLHETVTHERRWETMFERLKAFRDRHGNCLVPNRYAADTQLGSWVSAQRRQYKIVTNGGSECAAMTPERAKKLRDIGFEWSTTNPRNVPWETRYVELRNFVANYGHAEVPMRWEENPQLSNWVSKQRHQYKLMLSARPSRLNAERVKMLNDIGFVWEASRRRLLDGSFAGSDDEGFEGSSLGGSSDGDVIKESPRSNKKPKLSLPMASKPKKKDAFPAFAEGKEGRLKMDPPAPMGYGMPHGMPMAAAGQMQANFGLWAAMAAQAQAAQNGQAPAGMMPPQAAMAAAAAAANPQLFMQQMSSMMPHFAGNMPGMPGVPVMPGMPFAPAAMAPQGMPVVVQQPQNPQSTQDPPDDVSTDEEVAQGGEQEEIKHGEPAKDNEGDYGLAKDNEYM